MGPAVAKSQRPLKRKRKEVESGEAGEKKDPDQSETTQSSSSSSTSQIDIQKKKEKQTAKEHDDKRSSTPNLSEVPEDQDVSEEPGIEAISHKERRKRKKLEKKMTTIPTNNPEEESKNPTSKAIVNSKPVGTIFTTTSRSNYSIWVGNLLFTTTPQELASFFEPCGKITRLNMPSGKREHEHNKGFAYIDFETESGVDKAMEKSESPLGGRKLLIKRASDYSGRPLASSITLPSSIDAASIPPTLMKSARKILDHQKQPPAPCLFFGNLGFETTSESIMSMLQAHHQAQLAWKPKAALSSSELKSKGPLPEEKEKENVGSNTKKDVDLKDLSSIIGIRKVRMGTFEDSGKCKGFAFVDFESVGHATNALLNPKNHKLDGRNLQVEYASADAVKRGGGSAKSIQHKKPSRFPTSDGDHHTPNKPHQTSNKPFKSSNRPMNFEKANVQSAQIMPTKIDSTVAPLKNNHQFQHHEPSSIIPDGDDYQAIKPKKEYKGRQKPGAVLANARRAPMGIIKFPDQCGKKTVFA